MDLFFWVTDHTTVEQIHAAIEQIKEHSEEKTRDMLRDERRLALEWMEYRNAKKA